MQAKHSRGLSLPSDALGAVGLSGKENRRPYVLTPEGESADNPCREVCVERIVPSRKARRERVTPPIDLQLNFVEIEPASREWKPCFIKALLGTKGHRRPVDSLFVWSTVHQVPFGSRSHNLLNVRGKLLVELDINADAANVLAACHSGAAMVCAMGDATYDSRRPQRLALGAPQNGDVVDVQCGQCASSAGSTSCKFSAPFGDGISSQRHSLGWKKCLVSPRRRIACLHKHDCLAQHPHHRLCPPHT